MNYGCNERQEKYGEHLGMDTLFDLFFAHSDILHYYITLLIVIALGNLFIINYQDRCNKEEKSQGYAYKEQTAVQRIILSREVSAQFKSTAEVSLISLKRSDISFIYPFCTSFGASVSKP